MAAYDLTDLDLFAGGFPHDVFEVHRAAAPVHWHEPTDKTPDGEGFWSVATYDLVLHVLTHADVYSSERGGRRDHGGTLLADVPVAGVVLNMMDDPRHSRIRRLVSTGLTPRTVRRLEEDLRARTRRLLAEVPDGDVVDLLDAVAAEVPMQAVCGLLGVPEDDRHRLAACVDHVFDTRDDADPAKPFDLTDAQVEDLGWMADYGNELIEEKRRCPADDMLSAAVQATLDEVEPSKLTDGELTAFFTLLFSAGAETTRNAIAGGYLALVEHPGELEALRGDRSLLGGAVEEVLRWTTPSPMKRRTATVDVGLGGRSVHAGDKVVVWEASANRDPERFADPGRFDIRRDPNPHLGFGHGVHFCLGAHLARLELRVVLEELLDAFGTWELAGAPVWTRSNRHTGIRSLPVRLVR